MKKWKRWLWLALLLLGVPIIIIVVLQFIIIRVPLTTLINPDGANSFLATVAQVLAGILAIVFSVSVLAVDIAADKYTPRLLSYFAWSWATLLTFFSIFGCTIIAVIAMGIEVIPMSQWRFLATVGVFVFCLCTLPYYFYQTLQLLDPRNLAERIKDDGRQGIKKQEVARISDAITSLGDIAIKTFEREEDEITKKYLDALHELEDELIVSNLVVVFSNPKKDMMSALFGLGIGSPVFNQLYRIFKAALSRKNEEIAFHIVNLLTDTITKLTRQSHNTEILKGTLRQYEDFVKAAIENKDASRFLLIHTLRKILTLPYSFSDELIKADYAPIILQTILKVNQIIIDRHDFELWKAELTNFSTISSIGDICFSLNNKLRELLFRDELLCAHWAWWNEMGEPLNTRITQTNKRVFELGLSKMEQVIPTSNQELQEKVQNLRNLLYQLWVTTEVYDVLFSVCVYAFYRKQFHFIKELWRHVNPQDTNTHWGNINLIRFDIGFLTYQMLQHSWWPDDIEDYHSSENYILRYYLLCLAYTLLHTKNDWQPTTPFIENLLLNRDEKYTATIQEELRTTYAFLINLPYCADKVLAQYEMVVSDKEEWNDVFNGQTSSALELARNWLEDTSRRQEWIAKAESIIKGLPLDNIRTETYRKSALKDYEEKNHIKEIATVAENNEVQNPAKISGYCHLHCPDKEYFTLIDSGEPSLIGGRTGFEAVNELVKEEVLYVIKTFLTSKNTNITQIKELDFDRVAKTVKKMSKAGYNPTILIVPRQKINSACQLDSRFSAQIAYNNSNEQYFVLDEATKLRIIELSGNHAVILDICAGIWANINPVEIEITECPENPLLVKIVAYELVEYQVLAPEAVEILEFISHSSTKQEPKSFNWFSNFLKKFRN